MSPFWWTVIFFDWKTGILGTLLYSTERHSLARFIRFLGGVVQFCDNLVHQVLMLRILSNKVLMAAYCIRW